MPFNIRDVQGRHERNPAAPQTQVMSPAFAVNPQGGDSIIMVQVGDSTPVLTPIDTAGNLYSRIGNTVISPGGADRQVTMWLATNILGGSAFQVTAKWGNSPVGSAYRSIETWCIDRSIVYNGDFGFNAAFAAHPASGFTSPAPPAESFFLAMLSAETGFFDNVFDPGGWNTEGVNGFDLGMHGRSRQDNFLDHTVYTAYRISSVVEQAVWFETTAMWYCAGIASFHEGPTIAIPVPTSLAPQTPCDPQSAISGGGKGSSGCNPGGINWIPSYVGGYGTVPQHADVTPGETITGKRELDLWVTLRHSN